MLDPFEDRGARQDPAQRQSAARWRAHDRVGCPTGRCTDTHCGHPAARGGRARWRSRACLGRCRIKRLPSWPTAPPPAPNRAGMSSYGEIRPRNGAEGWVRTQGPHGRRAGRPVRPLDAEFRVSSFVNVPRHPSSVRCFRLVCRRIGPAVTVEAADSGEFVLYGTITSSLSEDRLGEPR